MTRTLPRTDLFTWYCQPLMDLRDHNLGGALDLWEEAARDAWDGSIRSVVEGEPDPVGAVAVQLEHWFLQAMEVECDRQVEFAGALGVPEAEYPMHWGYYWEHEGRATLQGDPRFHAFAAKLLKLAVLLRLERMALR